jgi:hypothetical protein
MVSVRVTLLQVVFMAFCLVQAPLHVSGALPVVPVHGIPAPETEVLPIQALQPSAEPSVPTGQRVGNDVTNALNNAAGTVGNVTGAAINGAANVAGTAVGAVADVSGRVANFATGIGSAFQGLGRKLLAKTYY